MPFSLLAFGLGTRSAGAKYRAPGRRAHAWWEEAWARQSFGGKMETNETWLVVVRKVIFGSSDREIGQSTS
jgi:hypothetical protein